MVNMQEHPRSRSNTHRPGVPLTETQTADQTRIAVLENAVEDQAGALEALAQTVAEHHQALETFKQTVTSNAKAIAHQAIESFDWNGAFEQNFLTAMAAVHINEQRLPDRGGLYVRSSSRGRGRVTIQAAQLLSKFERMKKSSSEPSEQAQPPLSKRAKKRLKKLARDFAEAEYPNDDEMEELMERQRIAASAPAPASGLNPFQGRTYTMSSNALGALPYNIVAAAGYQQRGRKLARGQKGTAAPAQIQSPSKTRSLTIPDFDNLGVDTEMEARLNTQPPSETRSLTIPDFDNIGVDHEMEARLNAQLDQDSRQH